MTHKYHIFYKTVHPSTGQYYYGIHSTNNISDGYQGSGVKIRELLDNSEHLITGIVETFYSRESALLFERLIVNEDLVADKLCLNQCLGGGGMPQLRKHTKETRAKMSRRAKQRATISDETRKKLSDAHKGRKYSLEEKFNRAQYIYVTPNGTYTSPFEASEPFNCSYTTLKRWCKSPQTKYSGFAVFKK